MGNKRVVHIVDDEETIRKALSFTLRTAGFAVEAYASGPEFLLSAEDAEKGCVVLDMHMPDMDGLTATHAIRALSGPAAATPILAVTADAMPQDAQRCLEAGIDGIITNRPAVVREAVAAVGVSAEAVERHLRANA